jgi:hypothetical protein
MGLRLEPCHMDLSTYSTIYPIYPPKQTLFLYIGTWQGRRKRARTYVTCTIHRWEVLPIDIWFNPILKPWPWCYTSDVTNKLFSVNLMFQLIACNCQHLADSWAPSQVLNLMSPHGEIEFPGLNPCPLACTYLHYTWGDRLWILFNIS